MTLRRYLKSRLAECLLAFVLFIFLVLFTGLSPMTGDLRAFMLTTAALFLTGIIFIGYPVRARFYKPLLKTLDALDQKHLLCEMISLPGFLEGDLLTDVLKTAGRSMNGAIAENRRMAADYREYIESWVHEIKTPIASARLIAENFSDLPLTELLTQIENYVTQALFYARSESLAKDYLIKPVSLADCVNPVLRENARTFILNHATIHTEGLDLIVRTDVKWLNFILRQILDNALKYCGSEPPDITITGTRTTRAVLLTVTDRGVGILPQDLPRVFDKGFTGRCGRLDGSRATGIGLYLCQKLCDQMDVGLEITSQYGEGTTVTLRFRQ